MTFRIVLKVLRRIAGLLLAAAFLSGAFAAKSVAEIVSIKFCNEFAYEVFVAIAYPQKQGDWLSRGWLGVPTGTCADFDSAIHVPTFYYRGETDYRLAGGSRRVRYRWGEDRKFFVQDDSFNFYDAENGKGGRFEDFSKFLDNTTITGDFSATVTFHADGKAESKLELPSH